MMIQTLIINIGSGQEKSILEKLLNLIGETSIEYRWIISDIEGSGFNPLMVDKSYIELEVDSKSGIEIDMNNISKFCNQFGQLIWISIICLKRDDPIDLSDYNKLHKDAYYFIELVDGGSREITTKDFNFQNKVLRSFLDVKIVNWNERYKKS